MTTHQSTRTSDRAVGRTAARPEGRSTGRRNRARSWPVPAARVGLSIIPLTAGVLRLVQLAGGPAVMPADHRFTGFPVPLVAHIVGAALFALVGALQFVPRLRRRSWHRRSGRMLVVAGLVVAISALWLTLFYQPQPGTGVVLYVFRLGVIGSGLLAPLALESRGLLRHSPPSRGTAVLASILTLTGGYLLRYAMVMAGRASADDPHATFEMTSPLAD